MQINKDETASAPMKVCTADLADPATPRHRELI